MAYWSMKLKTKESDWLTGKRLHQIQILVGVDMLGNILTGKCEKLECGLVKQETLLGWVVFRNILGAKINNK